MYRSVWASPRGGITAAAHKIARIFYAIVSRQLPYDKIIWRPQDAQRDRREQNKLKRQARKLGYHLVPTPGGLTEEGSLTRISHHLTVEARARPATTSLHLLAVLNVLSSTPPLVKRRPPRTDGPLTHFASPRGEKSGLEVRELAP